ncbi:cytochrome b/b6 domain-containing protein [Pseudomonas sp. PD9R]|nr:cytochrome b/b6 domain-containing protein [Pseudomonas sp. PD9R]MBV6824400.1 cytochrome b/b6 domain-containing protein [Pseudomonas sp. PD9R]
MKNSGYSRQRVLLHWLSAVVILWTLASGFYVTGIEVSAGVKYWVGFINVSLTTVFIPFFVWRLCIFAAHARYTRVSALFFEEKLALFAHTLIYLTVSIVLVTGVLMMDRPINVFGVVEIAQPLSDPELIAQFFTAHVWACVVLSGLIAVHVAAVIVHEVCGHRILRRMSLRLCPNRPNERFE